MSKNYEYLNSIETAKLFDLILQLSSELHVTRQRLSVLEMALERSGALGSDALEGFEPDSNQKEALDSSREAMMERLLRIVAESGGPETPLREQWEQLLSQETQVTGQRPN